MNETIFDFINTTLSLVINNRVAKVEQIIEEVNATYKVQIYQVGNNVRIDIIPQKGD